MVRRNIYKYIPNDEPPFQPYFCICSALDEENVETLFSDIIDDVLRVRESGEDEIISSSDSDAPAPINSEPLSCCCLS